MKRKGQLIVALDLADFSQAKGLVKTLGSLVDVFKVGSQLFTAYGPAIVQHILAQGKEVFLDLKFHDIPNTVANAVKSAVGLRQGQQGLLMLTVHTLGGSEMLKAAVEAASKEAQNIGVKRPWVVGITVLTSEEKRDNIRTLVLERAQLAKDAGCDGVVASVEEAQFIREKFGPNFLIVTPGIRPAGAQIGDQKRVASPQAAVKAGSNFLVVGRPIVKAQDPLAAARKILEEIVGA